MSRRAFIVLWTSAVIAAAVAITLAVDASSGTLRRVLSFEPFHVVGHIALFAVLAAALEPFARKRPVTAALLFITAAAVQEGAQSLAIGRAPNAESVYDFGLDVVGGCLALLWCRWWRTRRVRA